MGDKLVYQGVPDAATGAMAYELYFFYDSYNHLTAIRYVAGTTNHYYYVTTNLQGDVLGIYTASGVPIASYDYDAWGNCTTTLAATMTRRQAGLSMQMRYHILFPAVCQARQMLIVIVRTIALMRMIFLDMLRSGRRTVT